MEHPIATMLKSIQRDEIRYCATCCPEKTSQPSTTLNSVRLQMKHQRMRLMWRAQAGTELHPENIYADSSRYAKWLIHHLDFYGISRIDCQTTLSLEQRYGEILAL